MILVEAALTIVVMVITGLGLYQRLARHLLGGRAGELPERDLVLLGTLPGLALVGTLATFLSALHGLRFGIVLFLTVAIFYLARRELFAMLVSLRASAADGFARVRQGNLIPLLATGAFFAAVLVGLLLSTIPAENVDIWVFHIPLAQSLIRHHGLAFPQLNEMWFYSNQPLFFETLYATAMLAVPNFIAANAVNEAILFGFVLLLLSFAKRARAFQFLVICLIFFWRMNFLVGAAQPMTDLPRSCFSAAAYLFAYRYACKMRCFDLAMSALVAGAAVAGKYTELVTPALICVTLAPFVITERRAWIHLAVAAIVFAAVSSIWYVKNLVLLGNPIYPFMFGHPGLSDQWMSDYMQEMTRPFDVADRGYSTNLLTLQGWRDLSTVLYADFRPLRFFAVIAILGVAVPRPHRWMLPFWSVGLFLFWYVVMFNSTRWAVTAILMILATAFITWAWVADRIVEAWNPAWPAFAVETAMRWLKRRSNPWAAFFSLVIVIGLAFGLVRLKDGHGHTMLPSWMTRELAVALVRPAHMEAYLDENKPGYAMYRYIGQHNLGQVLQPFDNGATFYASAYNGGQPNGWMLRFDILPGNIGQTDQFLAQNNVHYFIDRPQLSPTEIERLGGADHIGLARAVIAKLKPRSRLLFSDGRGMALYQILPARPSL